MLLKLLFLGFSLVATVISNDSGVSSHQLFFASFHFDFFSAQFIPEKIQQELFAQIDDFISASFTEANEAFDKLVAAINETNHEISANLTISRQRFDEQIAKFPFNELEDSSAIDLAIKKVIDLTSESINKTEVAIDFFLKSENGVSPADKAILKLVNATVEMKTLIRKANYECSQNIYPQIIPNLREYTKDIVTMTDILIQYFGEIYKSTNTATEKSIKSAAKLTNFLAKCEQSDKKQKCVNQFVRTSNKNVRLKLILIATFSRWLPTLTALNAISTKILSFILKSLEQWLKCLSFI